MASISNAKRGKPKASKNSTTYDSASESESCDVTLSLTKQFSSVIDEIKKNMNKQFECLEMHVNNAILELRTSVDEVKKENSLLKDKCSALEHKVELLQTITVSHSEHINTNERFLRKNNVRIVGFQSAANEDCRQIASAVFKNILKRDVKIERAHRDGRTYHNRSQHVLVKCSNYEDKFDLLKLSRRALSDQPTFLVDDLTKNDLHERKKWSAPVKQLYSAGVKLKFYNGKWRGEGGRPYTFA